MRTMKSTTALLTTLLLASCGTSSAPATYKPVTSPTGEVQLPVIVAFGDSLTAGQGVDEADSYPGQLQAKLDAEGLRYRVVNAGVSGDTSAQALDRVDWALKEQPVVVIVVIGANDGLRGLPLDQLEQNLRMIVQKFQAAGATVVLGGMKAPPNYGLTYTRDFAAIYPRVAQDSGAVLIPFFLDGVAAERGLNQRDGIHPTKEGYTRIVEDVLWPVLEGVVRR